MLASTRGVVLLTCVCDGEPQATDDSVKALAAQKLCYLSRHGQNKEKMRRQSYIASMGKLLAFI